MTLSELYSVLDNFYVEIDGTRADNIKHEKTDASLEEDVEDLLDSVIRELQELRRGL